MTSTPTCSSCLDQLRRCLEEENGDFKGLWSDDIESLMEHVSTGFPGVIFFVRGMGEESMTFGYACSKTVRSPSVSGPFEEELDSSLGDD